MAASCRVVSLLCIMRFFNLFTGSHTKGAGPDVGLAVGLAVGIFFLIIIIIIIVCWWRGMACFSSMSQCWVFEVVNAVWVVCFFSPENDGEKREIFAVKVCRR